MIGILTEKPSARENFISAFYGDQETGRCRYKRSEIKIVASQGHIFEFASPELQVSETDRFKMNRWSLKQLPWKEDEFSWIKTVSKGKEKILQEISRELRDCSEIVIATDNDPSGEGELLAWEILQGANLIDSSRIFSRMLFIDETREEILESYINRRIADLPEKNSVFLKALYRNKFDFLSMQYTRAASVLSKNMTLRQGRLKTAMVRLIGDQTKKRTMFRQKQKKQIVYLDEDGHEFVSRQQTDADLKQFEARQSGIRLVQEQKLKTLPPQLPDLMELTCIMAEKGYSAKDVLDTYQKLYQAGYVTYPRTADKKISENQWRELKLQIPQLLRFTPVPQSDLKRLHKPENYKWERFISSDIVHGANRPGKRIPESLEELEPYSTKPGLATLIYRTLVFRAILTCLDDSCYKMQTGEVLDDPNYRCKIKVLEPDRIGWRRYAKKDELSRFSKPLDATQTVSSSLITKLEERPPAPTMRWLMQTLKNHDVGTGATRTSVFAEMVDPDNDFPLVDMKGTALFLTHAGNVSYELTKHTHIADLSMTEEVLSDMKQIESGRLAEKECLHRLTDYLVEDLETMKENAKSLQEGTTEDAQYVYGTWQEKEIRLPRTFRNHVFFDTELEDLFAGKQIVVQNLVSKKGSKYCVLCKVVPDEKYGAKIQSTRIQDTTKKIWCQHKFTKRETEMLAQGKEIYLEDCVSSKTGKPFKCYVRRILEGDRFIIHPRFS